MPTMDTNARRYLAIFLACALAALAYAEAHLAHPSFRRWRAMGVR